MIPDIYIYALCEPETGEVRYVGKATNTKSRLASHLCDARSGEDTRKARWLRKLLRNGQEPQLLVLDCVPHNAWQDAERAWIEHYRALGARLTNTMEGGYGGFPAGEAGEKLRAKLSEMRKGKPGRPMSAKLRAKLYAIHTGAKRSEETRARISAKALGRQWTVEQRARMSEQRMGRIHSEETRAKISAKLKGRKVSAESRSKIAAAHKGKSLALSIERKEQLRNACVEANRQRVRTPEARAKVSASVRAYYASRKGSEVAK